MKQNTLTKIFFLNYLCMLIFLLAGVWVTNSYSSAKVDEVLAWVSDDRIMNAYDVYEAEGAKVYYETLGTELGYSVDYFVIISPNDVVLDQYGSPYSRGHQFPEKESNGLINDPDTYAFYPNETDEIMIVKLTGNQMKNRINAVLLKSWGAYSLSVILLLYLLTRMTAIKILRPIECLTNAVREVGNGQYDINAEFEAKYELGQLKEALLAMSKKIQEEDRLRTQSEADRRQLVLNISHDLKTPLTNIRGYSETALSQYANTDETLKNYLTIIQNNSIKADTLLKNLFELSRIENAGFVPNLTSQDIGEVIRRILTDYIPELEAAGIEYDIEIPPELIIVHVDEALIRRAFSNLLDNSIRYLAGIQNPMLSIGVAHENGDMVGITVTDNGPGIPEELREKVFKPFVTTDQSRNRSVDGTGLGLAITRAIIEKHKGTVSVIDRPTQGASFEILLPMIEIKVIVEVEE